MLYLIIPVLGNLTYLDLQLINVQILKKQTNKHTKKLRPICLLLRIVFAVQSTDSHKYFQRQNTLQYLQCLNVCFIKLIDGACFHVCESKTDLHCILNCFLKLKIIIMYASHIILVSVNFFVGFVLELC